jgi:hypothetical protein
MLPSLKRRNVNDDIKIIAADRIDEEITDAMKVSVTAVIPDAKALSDIIASPARHHCWPANRTTKVPIGPNHGTRDWRGGEGFVVTRRAGHRHPVSMCPMGRATRKGPQL